MVQGKSCMAPWPRLSRHGALQGSNMRLRTHAEDFGHSLASLGVEGGGDEHTRRASAEGCAAGVGAGQSRSLALHGEMGKWEFFIMELSGTDHLAAGCALKSACRLGLALCHSRALHAWATHGILGLGPGVA